MDSRVSLLNRIKLKLNGNIYIEKKRNSETSFYLINCPKHGLVKSNPSGYKEKIYCPICRLEFLAIKYPNRQEEIQYMT